MTKSTKSIKENKAIKAKAAKAETTVKEPKRLKIGTIVVHNYTEFTHGVIVGYVGDAYQVLFTPDMAPRTPKYQANTNEALVARVRTITHGKGFFVSKHKTIEEVQEAQRQYKNRNIES